jgi:uncharacterized protein YidB (DUF937 family)
MTHGAPDAAIESWVFNEDSKSIVVEDLAEELFQTAVADGEEHDGPTKYTVLAYYGGQEYPSGRCPATTILSAKRSDGDYQETEPANGRGFAAQQMRHNEALMRMLVGSANTQSQHTIRALEKAYSRIEGLEEERGGLLEVFERLQQNSHERELENRDQDARLRNREDMLEQLKVLLPTVVNKLSGQKLLPEKTTPRDEIVHNLLASLNSDQLSTIQAMLTPAQLAGFAELYEAEAKKAEGKKTKKGADT